MMNKTVAFASLGGALLYLATTAIPAAAIVCQGAYTYNSAAGALISSSYCEDKLIALVGRKPFNGPNGVRQNPSVKEEACRFGGSDIRIRDLCAGHLFEDSGGRRN